MASSRMGSQEPPKPWYKSAMGKILLAVAGIVTTVAGTVLATSVNARVNPPQTEPTPTGTSVTDISGTPTVSTSTSPPSQSHYSGSSGTGWSLTPSSLQNDFVSVIASMDPSLTCDGATGWVFPQSSSELEFPSAEEAQAAAGPNVANFNDWATRNGGVPRSDNYVTLQLANRSHVTVVIERIGVQIISRATPTAKTAANVQTGCGGGVEPAYFSVNLDSPTPQVKGVAGEQNGVQLPPVSLPRKLTDSDPESWIIHLETNKCDCSFNLYFTWSSGGHTGTFTVSNHGAPWRISSASSLPTVYPNLDTKSWATENQLMNQAPITSSP